ncbi:MAG: hypothetical protein QOG04_975 [Actinomycetota bacterium]|jgi:FkbM family methyltransferase|nr:hypothetical protein [Actinomycetota bacterium]
MTPLSLVRTRGLPAVVKAVLHGARGAIYSKVLNCELIRRRVFDFEMLLDLNDEGISRTLLLFGKRELEHKWMLEQVLKPGMNVLDIGANIGYYPLIELGLIGSTGSVVAVEPSAINVDLLRKNLELNGKHDVPVVHAAVSDRTGTVSLLLSRQRNLNTLHQNGAAHLSGESVEVQALTISEVSGNMRPDLIRMDVEGHEVEILSDLATEVESGSMAPMVLFETHLRQYSLSHDITRPLQRLLDAGYQPMFVGSSTESGAQAIKSLGYRSTFTIRTDDMVRSVFTGIASEHLLDLVSVRGGVRSVLLVPPVSSE